MIAEGWTEMHKKWGTDKKIVSGTNTHCLHRHSRLTRRVGNKGRAPNTHQP